MTDSKNIQARKKFKILLLGDSCIDEYYIGNCERLSPEAPVPVIKIESHYTTPGMASNVKSNFEKINQSVKFISNQDTIKKIRYIDKRSGQHLLRVDDEPRLKPWKGTFPYSIDNFDAIVISDYNKGFLTYEHIENIIKETKKPVFVDTKKIDLARFEGAFIKINLYEFNNLTSTPKDLKGMIVTHGERGAMFDNQIFTPPKVEVADVCGAGDTFLAFLVYGYLLNNNDIIKGIEIANKAASISVTHRGNYSPTYEEVFN